MNKTLALAIIGTSLALSNQQSAIASDLNCTIQHVQASQNGAVEIDQNITGTLTIENYDVQSASYQVDLNANGTQKTVAVSPVTLNSGELYSYSGSADQSVAGMTVTIATTLKVLSDNTFVMQGTVTGNNFPTTVEIDTGTCN